MPKSESRQKKKVSFALQGGGSHGAFTWGVLDRFLEENIEIDGVVGTSAGAMNAVSILQGLIEGGNEGARKVLGRFWEGLGAKGQYSMLQPSGLDMLQNNYTMYNSPQYILFDSLIKNFSPYQLNPADIDPLKDLIEEVFDFDLLSRETKHKVFLCATQIRDGKVKIFKNQDLCPEALLASGCLPFLHKAVAVGGEYYWDGGFTANPAIYPLIYGCEASSIVIVQLNPTLREDLPKDVRGISDRLNEISNNVTLMRELRAINLITQWIDDGHLKPSANARRLDVHIVQNDQVFQPLGFSSKLNCTPEFLHHLFEEGRKSAEKWIHQHWDMLGVGSTADHYLDNDF